MQIYGTLYMQPSCRVTWKERNSRRVERSKMVQKQMYLLAMILCSMVDINDV